MADPMTTQLPTGAPVEQVIDTELDRIRAHRATLKNRHSEALSRLMAERADLRGVHALADLVDDSLRWSA
ncbi:hypothetical protein [Nocardioides flavescens]|uniref:Uncharacterized protein n=1 Tax=Nocardioides flavescens TaxID=2691959 RepID=A0A6L7EZ28_9ACTN|nr:hypothetical protein [Nocardioides flavescens]